MVRTISKMFLKKRFFSLLTSLTCEHCIFSRAHHWLLHSFPPLSICLFHLLFSRPCHLLCTFSLSGLVMPPLARVSRLSGCIFYAHIIGYFTIFPELALPLSLLFYFPALVCMCVPALLFRFSLLYNIELVVMLSVQKLAHC